MELTVSFFRHHADNRPAAGVVAWPRGFDAFRTGGKEGPLWSPATFTGGRAKANVVSVSALVLDYDAKHNGAFDAGELMDRWEKYEHIVHSTYSPGSYRVVLPFDRPATLEEHAAVWAWAYGLDARIDGACKDASRIWYWPTVSSLDVPPVFGYNEGERLGVGRVADLRPLARPPSRSTSPPPSPPPGSEKVGGSIYVGIEQSSQREDLALIESRCAFMRHVRADAATLSEPEWYAGLSIVARCVGGDALAHELSAPHPGYSYEECEAKYTRAKSESGPRTCREIRTLSRACAGCPLQVTSPVLLGRSDALSVTRAGRSSGETAATFRSQEPEPDRTNYWQPPGSASPAAPDGAEDLHAAVTEAQAAYDRARLEEDAALVAVEAAKKRLRYLRSLTAVASEEDLPLAVTALADAKARARTAERARSRAEKTLAAARARTSVAGLPPGADPAVWQRLRIEKERPASTLANVLTILDGDPRWSSRLSYDQFGLDVCVDRAPLPEERATELTAQLSYDYALDTKTDLVMECLRAVAKKRPFHPVQEWLAGLTWDGTPRMADLMHSGFGAAPTDDDQVIRLVGERFLLSMVARVMRPGEKVDTMLVLVGSQGARKSTALKTLAGGSTWFGATKLDLLNKDSYMMLRGKWLYEVAEFDSVRRVEASTAKAWLSSEVDTYRAPYARRAEDHPRQTVMAGTTNEDEFLLDPSGWRRYWPVRVVRTDLDWLARHREQLFAEAAVRYRAGEKWWFDEGTDEARRLSHVTSPFQATHPWAEVLYQWLLARKTSEPFGAVEVMRTALGRQTGDLTQAEKTLVGHILIGQLGCRHAGRGPGGTLYLRPEGMPAPLREVPRVREMPTKGT